jgi:hypothetical protein
MAYPYDIPATNSKPFAPPSVQHVSVPNVPNAVPGTQSQPSGAIQNDAPFKGE